MFIHYTETTSKLFVMVSKTPTFTISLLIFIAGVVAVETGFSVAIIEIIAGVIGRNAFGISANTPWIEFLANVGLLGVMFFAGFETDMTMLRKTWRQSFSIGALSYLVPFVGITIASSLILRFHLGVILLLAILSSIWLRVTPHEV